jgi:predicted nucleic acid-binding protein
MTALQASGPAVYVDSSAFIKLYVSEPESVTCERLLESHSVWLTARHTQVEVRRNLARLLQSRELRYAQVDFGADWDRTHVVELDRATCALAAELAETTGARTMDALHLAGAQRAGGGSLPFLTYDLRQAQIARSLAWTVLGT